MRWIREELDRHLAALEARVPAMLKDRNTFFRAFEDQVEIILPTHTKMIRYTPSSNSRGSSSVPGSMTNRWLTLPRLFYRRDPRVVAPELLNKLLVREDGRAGRIVEVEAYCGPEDPAAHTYGGKTRRNATMFGDGGHLYVYFTYGMHWCANAVCGEAGHGVGVLIRAMEPVAGIEAMRQARTIPARDREIGSGPARLAQAMGITGALDGADLVEADQGLWLADDGMPPPGDPVAGPRVGISKAVDHPWRWHVAGNTHVSRTPRRPLGR